MAFQIQHTDQYGNTHPESYWRIMFLAADLAGRTARVEFLGFKDKSAHDSGKQPIGSRSYSVSGSGFDAYLAGYEQGQTDLFALGYTYALAAHEVGEAPAPGEEDTRVSFFNGATVV